MVNNQLQRRFLVQHQPTASASSGGVATQAFKFSKIKASLIGRTGYPKSLALDFRFFFSILSSGLPLENCHWQKKHHEIQGIYSSKPMKNFVTLFSFLRIVDLSH